MTQPTRVITIPVPAALHTVCGVVLALITITAFWAHIEIPPGHPNKGTALGISIFSGCTALTYWLWCGQQCTRAGMQDIAESVEDARAELRTAKAEVLAKIDGMAAHVSEIDAVVAENQGSIKELTDAVDGLTASLGKVAQGLRALRECYLQEGTIPEADEDVPPETW